MKTFENVASLKLAKLKAGQFVGTGGYYGKGGRGAAKYFIKTSAQATLDGDNYSASTKGNLLLANGNVAVVQIPNRLFLDVFGCVGDGVTDDYEAIVECLSTGEAVYGRKNTTYAVSEEVQIPNRGILKGKGESTVFKWIGLSPVLPPGNSSGKSVINVSSDNPTTVALSNVEVGNFSVDLNAIENMTAVKWIYASVQSFAKNIRVSGVAAGCVGFYFSQTWYASFDTLSVRAGGKPVGSTGFYIGTGFNQVNGVPFNNMQVNSCDIGIVLDTSNYYHYANTISGLMEKCNVGLLHIGGLGVRQMNAEAMYFEANDVADIQWLSPVTPADRTGDIVWQSCSFNANGSKVILEEGSHRFLGCNIISDMTIESNAAVWIDGNAGMAVVNNGGELEHVKKLTWKNSRQSYSSVLLDHKGGVSFFAIMAGGVTPQEVFPIPDDMLGNVPVNGYTIKLSITGRRTYAGVENYFEGYLSSNSSGDWFLTASSASPVTSEWEVSVNAANGDVSVKFDSTDTKIVNVSWEPF